MPIIVRCTPAQFQNVDPAWDKNRCEISDAPEYIQTISQGVCGIVPGEYLKKGEPNRPGNFRSHIIDIVGQKVDKAKRTLVDTAQGHMAAKLKLKIDDARKLHENTVDEQEKDKAWKALKQAEEVAVQYSKWIKSHLKTLDSIEWPMKEKLNNGSQTLGLEFLDQPVLANSTGFHISKGYVMTAAHCIPMEERWHEYRIFFNLRMRKPLGSGIQYDSSHLIKRIVVHSFGDPESAPVNAGIHDIAVVEITRATKVTTPRPLDAHPLDGYPSQTLSLASEVVKLGQGPLGLLGHPHSLPLKYASVYLGDIGAPKVLVVTNGPLITLPVFTADIEVFPGNSGGPLVHNIRRRTGDVTPVVVGIARAQSESRLPPDRGLTQLDVAVRGWLNAAAEKAQLPDDEKKELMDTRQAALPSFRFAPPKGSLQKRLTLEQVKATNKELEDRIFFNRVDFIRPFTVPVIRSIQEDWRIVKVIVEIDLWPQAPDRKVSPTIFVSNVEAGQESPYTLGNELPKDDGDGNRKGYSTYRWVRYIEDVEELNRPFQILRMVGPPGAEIPAARGFGDMPKELFESPNGFCSWSKMTVKTDRTDRVGSRPVSLVRGKLSVVFGFEKIREYRTIRQTGFTNHLVFVSLKGTEWIAYIGRRSPSEGGGGSPWKGPCEPIDEHRITWEERAL